MAELSADVERQLADMSPEDFAVLVARVRPSSFSDQLREVASQYISGERLESFIAVSNPKAFALPNGDIDPGKVDQFMTGVLGVQGGQPGGTGGQSGSNYRDWGQNGGPVSGPGPGGEGSGGGAAPGRASR